MHRIPCLLVVLALAGWLSGRAAADTFYVSSFADNKLVKLDAAGTKSDFTSGFGLPYGLAFDSAGLLYVGGSETTRVYRIQANGTKLPFAKLATDGMTALAFGRDGQLYIASQNSSSIIRVARTGASAILAGKLPFPFGLAFDRDGVLHVAYMKNGSLGRVDQVMADGSIVPKFGGLSLPRGLAFDASGNLFIADYGNGFIRKVTPGGTISIFAANLGGPSGIAFDSKGDLYVVSEGPGTVSRITPDGQVHPFASGLHMPLYIAVEPDNTAIQLIMQPPAPGDLEVNGMRLRLRGWPLQFYSLEFATDLTSWNPLIDAQLVGGAELAIQDASSVGVEIRYYRAKLLP